MIIKVKIGKPQKEIYFEVPNNPMCFVEDLLKQKALVERYHYEHGTVYVQAPMEVTISDNGQIMDESVLNAENAEIDAQRKAEES